MLYWCWRELVGRKLVDWRELVGRRCPHERVRVHRGLRAAPIVVTSLIKRCVNCVALLNRLLLLLHKWRLAQVLSPLRRLRECFWRFYSWVIEMVSTRVLLWVERSLGMAHLRFFISEIGRHLSSNRRLFFYLACWRLGGLRIVCS